MDVWMEKPAFLSHSFASPPKVFPLSQLPSRLTPKRTRERSKEEEQREGKRVRKKEVRKKYAGELRISHDARSSPNNRVVLPPKNCYIQAYIG